jgi:hypothetical protein
MAAPVTIDPQTGERVSAVQIDPATGERVKGEQKGFLESLADATGLSSVSPSRLIDIAIPSQAGAHAVQGLFEEGKRSFNEARAGLKSKDLVEQQKHFTAAVPFVGQSIVNAGKQVDEGNIAGAAGTGTGILASEFGPEVIGPAARVAGRGITAAAEATGEAASKAKSAIYPESTTVTAPEAAARKLAKALTVQVQGMPNFVSAATEEAGTVLDYAKKNNIQINSTVDFAKAAKGAADSIQSHFDDVILKPNEGRVVNVPPDYRGAKLNVEGSRATLGEINQRINAINQEMSPNYRKATAMQTSAANVSDADLLAEKRKLTSLLHDNLADATGLEPEDIAALRRKAGKLRTIADEANYSANTNTNAAGKAAMGGTDLPAATKMGILERGVQAVRGGPEIIGNRALKAAVRDISPTELVLPNPRISPAPPPIENPVQNQSSPMVRPVYNEPLQEYIRRKKAARAQK